MAHAWSIDIPFGSQQNAGMKRLFMRLSRVTMNHLRARVIVLGCCISFLGSALAAELSIWKWQPPYDPPDALRPILAKRGIPVEDWRFCEAIRHQTRDVVIALLDKGANPRVICDKGSEAGGMPAIFVALTSVSADPELVKALVRKGANVNERFTPEMKLDSEGKSLLDRFTWAIFRSSQNTDYFPLYYAAKNTNSQAVEVVLQFGADIKAQTGVHRRTAMFVARDMDIAQTLLRFGANINDKDTSGISVLKATRDSLTPLGKTHYLRPKLEAYVAWLEAHGAHE